MFVKGINHKLNLYNMQKEEKGRRDRAKKSDRQEKQEGKKELSIYFVFVYR